MKGLNPQIKAISRMPDLSVFHCGGHYLFPDVYFNPSRKFTKLSSVKGVCVHMCVHACVCGPSVAGFISLTSVLSWKGWRQILQWAVQFAPSVVEEWLQPEDCLVLSGSSLDAAVLTFGTSEEGWAEGQEQGGLCICSERSREVTGALCLPWIAHFLSVWEPVLSSRKGP